MAGVKKAGIWGWAQEWYETSLSSRHSRLLIVMSSFACPRLLDISPDLLHLRLRNIAIIKSVETGGITISPRTEEEGENEAQLPHGFGASGLSVIKGSSIVKRMEKWEFRQCSYVQHSRINTKFL